jgi:hypothetical protein
MPSNYEYSLKTCAPDRDMWEQQPGESDDRYAMFCFYKDMGSVRTHDLVAAHYGKSNVTIRNYASAFLWRPRISAYERDMAERRGDQLQRNAVEANLRTIEALDQLEKFAFQAILARNPEDFTNTELIKLLDSIHTNKAKYIGMPTYRPDAAVGLGSELPSLSGDPSARDDDLKKMIDEFKRRNPELLSESDTDETTGTSQT